jgi:hypothetical protein
MANAPHDIMVEVLRDQPDLLDRLSRTLTGRPLPKGLEVADSTVRQAQPIEVRPDAAFQRGVDWLLLELKETKRMGDLVVITHSRAVAEWAKTVAVHQSAKGTKLGVEPVVLLLDEAAARKLLEEKRPELAFFAAWAMQERHGPEAKEVVQVALKLSDGLPEPLQVAMKRAILNVLSEKMLAFLKEAAMNPDQIPEGPAMRLFRLAAFAEGKAEGKAEGEAEGEARGEAKAILTVLRSRDIAVDAASEARILGCHDLAELDRWLARAAKVARVEELFSGA